MLIVDKQQFDKRIELLPELGSDEVYFISLSARSKYLSADEQLSGKTIVFNAMNSKDGQTYRVPVLTED